MAKKTAPAHGYAGRTLAQKMGLKPGMRCLTLYAPLHYADLMSDADDVTFLTRARSADVVHLFCARRSVLDKNIKRALSAAGTTGALWISWPKKSSPRFVDLTEDNLREVLLPLGWVDVKVCAVDADWSGLKFVLRKENR